MIFYHINSFFRSEDCVAKKSEGNLLQKRKKEAFRTIRSDRHHLKKEDFIKGQNEFKNSTSKTAIR